MSIVQVSTEMYEELAQMFNPNAWKSGWQDAAKKEQAQKDAYRQADVLLNSEWMGKVLSVAMLAGRREVVKVVEPLKFQWSMAEDETTRGLAQELAKAIFPYTEPKPQVIEGPPPGHDS